MGGQLLPNLGRGDNVEPSEEAPRVLGSSEIDTYAYSCLRSLRTMWEGADIDLFEYRNTDK